MKKNALIVFFHIRKRTLKTWLAMKIILLLSNVFVFTLNASVLPQGTLMSIEVKDQTIREVVHEIEAKSEYRFFYNDQLANLDDRIDFRAENMSEFEVIELLFEGQELTFKLMENNLVLIMPTSLVQQLTITGIVTDEAGQPLPGVSVTVKGTTQGTITDADGNYSLSVAPDDSTLVFSFIGMKTVSELINGRTNIDVILETAELSLEEVVVVGYGVQKKVSLTGAIGVINSGDIEFRPAANTSELLQGQIPGLITRQSSGLPGDDGTQFSIRGFGSPLVLVDGVESDLGQIDPNDIESISVLKDASAAIYGARAGNGVILVTTKRGTDKPSSITYHGSVSFAQPTFFPDLVGARKYAELWEESGHDPNEILPRHLSYDLETNKITNILDGSDFNEGYDWFDALMRDWTPQQQHNISAQGGTKRIAYYVSAGFTDQASNFRSGDYDFNRYNIRSNIDAMISKNLSVSVDFSYRSAILDKGNFNVTTTYNLLGTVQPFFPYIHEADPTRAAYSGFMQRSPYAMTQKEFSGFVEDKRDVLLGAFELKYSFPMIGLTAKARLSYENIYTWNKDVLKPSPVYEYDEIAARDGEDPWIFQGIQNASQISITSGRGNQLIPLLSLEYDRSFGKHNLQALIMSETITYNGTSVMGSRKDLLSYTAPYLGYASEEGKDNTEGTEQRARTGIIGRVNYDYMGKYFLTFSMRADASASYPPEGRWGYFPNISAGWRISEESFIKENFSAVSNLKLRASYGILGNDAVSSFDYLSGYNINTDFYVFGSTPGPEIISAGLANPDITWETMKISNIGLDGTLWKGKLGFEIDAFYRLRENILATPVETVPTTFGASLPQTNLDKRDNRGIEIVLTHKNRIGDFSYDISPIFSWSRGKYLELQEKPMEITDDMDEETRMYNQLYNKRYMREGQWDDQVWGYLTNGFFMNQQEIDNHPIDQDQAGNQTIIVGDLVYKDLNGDNYIDWRDEAVIGTGALLYDQQQSIGAATLPKITYGLRTGIGYKGIRLSLLFQGASDFLTSIEQGAAGPFASGATIPYEVHYKYRAIVGTDNNGEDYITNPDDFKLPPVTDNGNTANNNQVNDFWRTNTYFIRLKNLNLSYALPGKLLNKVGISNCTFYFSGTNLLTISNLGIWKNSFDPEQTRYNNKAYPPVKTVSFGLSLTF